MNIAYLGIGSNQGNRKQLMQQAIELLAKNKMEVTKTSYFYETKAWGITDQPDFLNMCIKVTTLQSAQELLLSIQQVESTLGRERDIKWGPRTIDIDILFYNSDVVHADNLNVPHPYIQDRRFVLLPLADIAANLVHPTLHKTVAQMLADCSDELDVNRV